MLFWGGVTSLCSYPPCPLPSGAVASAGSWSPASVPHPGAGPAIRKGSVQRSRAPVDGGCQMGLLEAWP